MNRLSTEDRALLFTELQAAQDHLAKCAGAIVRADHSLAHLMYQTGMQIKTLVERLSPLKKCPYCQLTPVESPHWRGHFGCPTESCAAYAANLTAEEWNTRAENLTLTLEDWLKDRK